MRWKTFGFIEIRSRTKINHIKLLPGIQLVHSDLILRENKQNLIANHGILKLIAWENIHDSHIKCESLNAGAVGHTPHL